MKTLTEEIGFRAATKVVGEILIANGIILTWTFHGAPRVWRLVVDAAIWVWM